jgi:hypothetical protein
MLIVGRLQLNCGCRPGMHGLLFVRVGEVKLRERLFKATHELFERYGGPMVTSSRAKRSIPVEPDLFERNPVKAWVFQLKALWVPHELFIV